VEKPRVPPTAPNAFETAATAPALVAFGPPQNASLQPVALDDIEVVDAFEEDAGPSREELLARAARLGPQRMTYLSMHIASNDPILREKLKPRVAERRARLRRIVKVALGACVAFCMVATAATALSSSNSGSSDAPVHARATTSVVVVPVEKMETPMHVRAPGHVTARAKRRY
jgi:hypothetical protein